MADDERPRLTQHADLVRMEVRSTDIRKGGATVSPDEQILVLERLLRRTQGMLRILIDGDDIISRAVMEDLHSEIKTALIDGSPQRENGS